MQDGGVEFGIIISTLMINESSVISSELGSKGSIEINIHSFAVFIQKVIFSLVNIIAE